MTALDGQADAPVLRDPPLGDVEVAHDLDPRDNAADHPLGHRGGLGEHAVDAHSNAHLAARLALTGGLRLEVNVRGAELGGLGDDRMHELDHRRVLGRIAQVDDLDGRGVVVLGDRLLDGVLEAVHPRDQRRDVVRGGDGGLDVHVRHQGDVVDRQDVRGV